MRWREACQRPTWTILTLLLLGSILALFFHESDHPDRGSEAESFQDLNCGGSQLCYPQPIPTRPESNQVINVFSVSRECDVFLHTSQECMDFLNTRQDQYLITPTHPLPSCDEHHPMLFHMYWNGLFRGSLTLPLYSFLFTQNLHCSKLILWVDKATPITMPIQSDWVKIKAALLLATHPATLKDPDNPTLLCHYTLLGDILKYSRYIELKYWSLHEQLQLSAKPRNVRGEPVPRYDWPSNLWNFTQGMPARTPSVYSDLIRFVLLDNFGGIYLDSDTVFLRDMRPWYYADADWAYSWGLNDSHNTAWLHFRPHSKSLSTIIESAIENALDFHPQMLVEYLSVGDSLLAQLSIQHQLVLFSPAIFDAAWLQNDKKFNSGPVLPNFRVFEQFYQEKWNTTDEFILLTGPLGTVGVAQADISNLRLVENFFPGSIAYHFHGNKNVIPDKSWAYFLNQRYKCFLEGACTNIYGEQFQPTR